MDWTWRVALRLWIYNHAQRHALNLLGRFAVVKHGRYRIGRGVFLGRIERADIERTKTLAEEHRW